MSAKRIERTHDLQAVNRYTLPINILRRTSAHVRHAALCNLYLYTAIGACAAGPTLVSPNQAIFLDSDAKLRLFYNIYVNVN